MRRFEFRDAKSAKFWSIDLQGKRFTVCFGKIGTTGQTQSKDFADAAKANNEHDKLVAEKVKKGYVEVGAGSTPASATAAAADAPKGDKAAASKKGRGTPAPEPDPVAPPAPGVPSPPLRHGPPSTGSATVEGLLAAVREEPDEDAPRLVLADWLEEQGDADRAELIRVQCRAAALEDRCDVRSERWCRQSWCNWDEKRLQAERLKLVAPRLGKQEDEYRSLLRREQQLLKAERKKLLTGLPPEGERKQTREGSQEVNYSLDYRLWRGLIVVWLRLMNRFSADRLDELEAMAEQPAFARVAEVVVDFSGSGFSYGSGGGWDTESCGPAQFERFLAHPALRHVTSLNMDDLAGPSSLPNLRSLAARRDLKRLTEVTARADYQEGGSIDVMELGRATPNLRRLALTGNYDDSYFVELAKCQHFPNLQELEVGNHIHLMPFDGAKVLQAFARSAHFPALRRIVFGEADGLGYSAAGVLELIRSPHLPRLEYVDIGLGEDDLAMDGGAFVPELAALPEASRLRILRLDNLRLADDDVKPLLTSPHLAGLEMLNMDGNRLSKAAVEQLRQRFPAVSADRQQK
jgi:uncharacterized protein (TIGR02996 family)